MPPCSRATVRVAAGAGLPKAGQPFPVGSEGLNPVVAPVGHEHVAFLVQPDPPGGIKLARAIAEAAELAQVPAVQGELLHPVVPAVHDEQDIVPDGQPRRTV